MFKSLSSLGVAIGVVFATLFSASAAVAETLPVKGQPLPGQMGLQNAATEMHSQITAMFNWGLTIPMTIIALFVTILLVWVMIRYNAKANPNPSSVTHNTMLEVVWIAIPTVIVLVLLVFAWRLIFFIDAQPQRPGLVITAVGKQWRWGYEYDRYMPSADYAQVQAALDMGDAYDGDITAVGEYVDLAGLTYDSCSKQFVAPAPTSLSWVKVWIWLRWITTWSSHRAPTLPSRSPLTTLVTALRCHHLVSRSMLGPAAPTIPGPM